jgi:hypothetical protein
VAHGGRKSACGQLGQPVPFTHIAADAQVSNCGTSLRGSKDRHDGDLSAKGNFGVSFEDRQDLLGHRSGRITTHYSGAELSRLIAAADSVCERDTGHAELVVLRGAIQLG